MRIDAERKRRALNVGRGVGKDAKSGFESRYAVEQQRRTVRRAGRDFGDPSDFMMRAGAVDTPQRPRCLDQRNESSKIVICDVHRESSSTDRCAKMLQDPALFARSRPSTRL